MKQVLIIGGAGVAMFLLVKAIAKQPQQQTGLIDNKGREIFLQEKNGFLTDQFGGVWA